jgi:1-deoxy-D-xylulose 5-phosphate reductoisomerase
MDIPRIIEQQLEEVPYSHPGSIEEYLEIDREVRGRIKGEKVRR